MPFQTVIILIVLGVLLFCGFVIYFIFKNIEFTIQAVNLYKKMIDRQDIIIKLLNDLKPTLKVKDTRKSVFAKKASSHSATPKPVTGNNNSTSKQKGSKDNGLTAKQRALMRQYKISYDGTQFLFQTYKYAKLEDAVKYAKFGASI